MKTSELSGAALDWAVATANGDYPQWDAERGVFYQANGDDMDYSTDWAQGGAIIERENISITGTNFSWWECDNGWYAHIGDSYAHGTTPLIAAMRCYVASKLGEEVELPKELL